MKKIYSYELNNASDNSDNTSPFRIYDRERVHRYSIDRPCGIWLTNLDKDICKALATYLVLTSDLIYRLFNNNSFNYEKKEIQFHLQKLCHSCYIQKLGFETDSGCSAAKAYVLAGRGIGLLNSAMGIRCKMGGYLAEQDHIGLKRLLSSNQLLISGQYNNVEVSKIVLIEPKNEHEKSSYLFRPTAICYNNSGEAYQFIESVRRTSTSEVDLLDKLKRVVQVYKRRRNANIKISESLSLIIVAEDYAHMIELAAITQKLFGKKLNILYTFDRSTYSCPADFLYEYCSIKTQSVFSKKAFAACF